MKNFVAANAESYFLGLKGLSDKPHLPQRIGNNFELALVGQPVKNFVMHGHEFNNGGKLLVWPNLGRWLGPCRYLYAFLSCWYYSFLS